MTNLVPFEFVSLVDEPGNSGFDEQNPPPKMWTEIEMHLVREEAEAAGYARAAEEARQSNEACINTFMETLTNQTSGLREEMARIEEKVTGDAVKLARAVAYKIAGEALHNDPLAVVDPVISSTLKEMTGPHRLQITVHEILKPAIETRINDLAKRTGFEGGIHVCSGASHMSDCHIEWATGGIARDHKTLMEQIDSCIAAHGHDIEPVTDFDTDMAEDNTLEFDFEDTHDDPHPRPGSGE